MLMKKPNWAHSGWTGEVRSVSLESESSDWTASFRNTELTVTLIDYLLSFIGLSFVICSCSDDVQWHSIFFLIKVNQSELKLKFCCLSTHWVCSVSHLLSFSTTKGVIFFSQALQLIPYLTRDQIRTLRHSYSKLQCGRSEDYSQGAECIYTFSTSGNNVSPITFQRGLINHISVLIYTHTSFFNDDEFHICYKLCLHQ